MFIKLLTAALAAAALIFLIWLARGYMLVPLRPGRSTRLSVVLRVSGPERALEETVDALLWLRENGTLPADIVIEDAGMDEETRLMAELLARGRGAVIFTEKEDADKWETPPSTSK